MEEEPRPDGHDTAASPIKNSHKNKKRKGDKLSASIEVLPDQHDKTAPLIGYFPTGFNPIGDGAEPPPEVKLYKCKEKRKTNTFKVVVRPPGLGFDYVGSSKDGEPEAVQPCTYALGVLDKELGSLKIIPIATNKIFRLVPEIESNDVEDKRSELNAEPSAKEKYEKMMQLTNMFGTKTSIAKAKKLKNLRQEADLDSQHALDKMIQEAATNKEALVSTSAVVPRNIPPYNTDATDPKEAYPLEKIILSGEWNHIADIVNLVEQGEKVPADAYPTFVTNRIYKLKEIKDKYERDTIGCVLSYINHLVKFKDRRFSDGYSSGKKHTLPSILSQRFSSLFDVPESKRMPKDKEDLLISYILVLCLFVDNFETDPTDIVKDLRMTVGDLKQHFENLGCKISKKEKIAYAKLKVPLKFPELSRRRRRRN